MYFCFVDKHYQELNNTAEVSYVTTAHYSQCIFTQIQCVRKVAVHLGYGTQIWLSLFKLPLKCAVVSLYSAVKQRLKCNTGKVCNCLIQLYSLWFVDLTSRTIYKFFF
jgi:hypothetical protein